MGVSLEDVSSVIRLFREVCDRWDDPAVWRAHLLRGACDLVGAHVGMILEDTTMLRPAISEICP
jgi:hypothetical protein